MADATDAPFDGGRTWLDVKRSVARRLRKKFRPLNIEDVLEDVLSEVIVDLIGYWMSLKSSATTSDQWSYAFAVHRGTWTGVRAVTAMFALHEQEVPFDPQRGQDLDGSGKHMLDTFDCDEAGQNGEEGRALLGSHVNVSHFTDPGVHPEDAAIDGDEIERARRVLESLSPDELADYFDNLLHDGSERAQAEKLGVGQTTFRERKAYRRVSLTKHAARFGLS